MFSVRSIVRKNLIFCPYHVFFFEFRVILKINSDHSKWNEAVSLSNGDIFSAMYKEIFKMLFILKTIYLYISLMNFNSF
jgi:hypothetical protein